MDALQRWSRTPSPFPFQSATFEVGLVPTEFKNRVAKRRRNKFCLGRDLITLYNRCHLCEVSSTVTQSCWGVAPIHTCHLYFRQCAVVNIKVLVLLSSSSSEIFSFLFSSSSYVFWEYSKHLNASYIFLYLLSILFLHPLCIFLQCQSFGGATASWWGGLDPSLRTSHVAHDKLQSTATGTEALRAVSIHNFSVSFL